MYVPGTKFKVVLKIKAGEQVFEPGLTGEILGSVNKMVGKSYKVKFEDGRTAEIHMVIMNNQAQVLKDTLN
ncbi:MAG: hypothetical protein L0213_10705 [Candidatus Dadabacteria bacterium]|nr:hypothetical protein [Candidatus Dadabacteria bacterium]